MRTRILFVAGNGSRKTVRLGKATIKQAEAFKLLVEALVTAGITGSLSDDLSRRVAGLPDVMHARLAAVGLVEGRAASKPAPTLGLLLAEFFAARSVKPSTVSSNSQTRKALADHFGEAMPLASITPLEADKWRQALKAKGLAEATIAKRVKNARQIFRQAIRWKMILENPFAELRVGSQVNRSRMYFVSRADAQRVADACPDAEWRLLFALSRFGGLRCPSEHLAAVGRC